MFKFFIIGIIILAIILTFLFLPWVRITLNLASQPFSHDLEVRIDGKTEKVLPQFNSIPARLVEIGSDFENVKIPPGFVSHPELIDNKEGKMLIFKEEDLTFLVEKEIESILAELGQQEKEGESKISWFPESLNLTENYAKLKVHIEKTVYPELNLEKIKKGLTGKNNDEIKRYLEDLPGVQGVEIRFWPSYLKKAPIHQRGIDISINIL